MVNEFGVDIINDVEEGSDAEMFRTVAELGTPYILMSKAPNIHDMLINIAREIQELRALGQKDIIIDPGFGFGKDPIDGNYALMNVMEQLHVLELPILVGISRKRMIHQLFGYYSTRKFEWNNCTKYDCTNERSKHFACTRCERSCRNGANLQPFTASKITMQMFLNVQ